MNAFSGPEFRFGPPTVLLASPGDVAPEHLAHIQEAGSLRDA
jgi:hypothetical protein